MCVLICHVLGLLTVSQAGPISESDFVDMIKQDSNIMRSAPTYFYWIDVLRILTGATEEQLVSVMGHGPYDLPVVYQSELATGTCVKIASLDKTLKGVSEKDVPYLEAYFRRTYDAHLVNLDSVRSFTSCFMFCFSLVHCGVWYAVLFDMRRMSKSSSDFKSFSLLPLFRTA